MSTDAPLANPGSPMALLLKASAERHSHLCPRQVLGVRMGLFGAACLGLETVVPQKRLWVIVETDGCFADGIEVSAGVSVGHRTLRVADYGKVAATFIDTLTRQAVRLAPRTDVRQRASQFVPQEPRHYFAQLLAYQTMPDEELFTLQAVSLQPSIDELVSRPGVRVTCEGCGEEIMNDRQVMVQSQTFCRACAGQAYYQPVETHNWVLEDMPKRVTIPWMSAA